MEQLFTERAGEHNKADQLTSLKNKKRRDDPSCESRRADGGHCIKNGQKDGHHSIGKGHLEEALIGFHSSRILKAEVEEVSNMQDRADFTNDRENT